MNVVRPEFPDHGSPFSRSQERERKITAICSAASRRFNAQGVLGARLEDIAADLGLTKTSISYYFASKEELAEDVFLRSVAFLDDAVKRTEAANDAPALKLLGLFQAYSEQLSEAIEDVRPFPARLQELDALSPEVQGRITTALDTVVSRVTAMVGDWLEQAGLTSRRAEPVTYCLFGLLDWLTVRAGEEAAPAFADTASLIRDILREGLTLGGPAMNEIAPQFVSAEELPQIFDRKARNRMKREAFLKTGIRFFNLYGFEGVSLAEVAASLGVTRGAFYYHIPDKESFLDQCLEHSLQNVETTLDAAAESGDGLAFIRRAVFDLIYMQASGMAPIIRLELMSALPATRRNRHQARLRNITRRLGDNYEAAVSTGEARPHDASIVESLLSGVMFINSGYTLAASNTMNDWRMSKKPQSATNDFLYVLLYGLSARS
ncbi:TetR/AcrR family transcriptional regulator [Oceanicaulis sp. LC35]|uniref:TetR/AcrR family transcriptional regulator n=1 Tax=Oceanicaulis sp. LC35 TaxID=3349635 RepID=UPI003F82BD1C